jgi:hypothetical protein
MAARVFLSVRDQANSPLQQTLGIGLAFLKRQQPASAISDALLKAFRKLIDLHEIFNSGKAKIDWSEAERLTHLGPSQEN